MKLMDGERVLVTSDNNAFTLTSHRLRHETKSDVVSIMLDQLCSCGIVHRDHAWMRVAAAACVVGAIAFQSYGNALIAGIVGALLLVVAYFVTRHQVLTFSSGGESINVKVTGAGLDKTVAFIDSVEAAKNNRYLLAAADRPPQAAAADAAPKQKFLVCEFCGQRYAEGQRCSNCKV